MPCSEDLKAVSITDLSHYYNSGILGERVDVLNNINMSIEAGHIYTLLGPSGCGKTSLIRCILGLTVPRRGVIKIFGRVPGKSQNIPGIGVGYMPQSSALFNFLTARENLLLFARLYHMHNPHDKVNELIKTLELPGQRKAGLLSGGQQRRLSLAVTIIHEPPFIILDEPTVGIDPHLQRHIWQYLTEMSRAKNISILFTTHYVEEARIADQIGFLSEGGTFIVQDEPARLLCKYSVTNLTTLFFKVYDEESHQAQNSHDVSLKLDTSFASWDESDKSESSGISGTPPKIDKFIIRSPKAAPPVNTFAHRKPIVQNSYFVAFFLKLFALVSKDFFALIRNPSYLLFQFLLPTVEISLFCICIGGRLSSIPVAVYNADGPDSFALSFLKHVDHSTLVLQNFSSREQALESVRNGSSTGAILIPENYTVFLNNRIFSIGLSSEQELNDSTIFLYPDMSNVLTVMTMFGELTRAFQVAGQSYLTELEMNPSVLELPIKMGDPVYGSSESLYRDFMTPGVILSIVFLSAISLTAVNLVGERKLGQFERCQVAGVSNTFLLGAQMLSHSMVVVVQSFLVLVMVFPTFDIPFHGDQYFIYLLSVLQSICGLAFGLMIASLSANETVATMLSLGFFYPSLLLSGTVWPTESMSPGLRAFTQYLPQTKAITAMRHMISRGWSPDLPEVFEGFLFTLTWTAFFLILGAVFFRRTGR